MLCQFQRRTVKGDLEVARVFVELILRGLVDGWWIRVENHCWFVASPTFDSLRLASYSSNAGRLRLCMVFCSLLETLMLWWLPLRRF